MPAVPITDSSLRSAMRDRRYWQNDHPERGAYQRWVGDGWRALHPQEGHAPANGMVWVEPYVREVGGQSQQVTGHWRTPRPGTNFSDAVQDVMVRRPTDPETGIPMELGRRPPPVAGGGSLPMLPPARGTEAALARQATQQRIDTLDRGSRLDRMDGSVPVMRRSGGSGARQADLESLAPVGQPRAVGEGGRAYTLPDGTQAIVRSGTRGEQTLEIQAQREGLANRFETIRKYRYDQ